MLERMKDQAAKYGFVETDYLRAFREVPVFTPERHTAMLQFLSQFA